MNLSSYLQMPPAPPASQTSTTTAPTGAPAGVSPVPGNSLGLDFAKIMARQFERMPQSQRQAFAAPAPADSITRANAQAQADDKYMQAADRQAQDGMDRDQAARARIHTDQTAQTPVDTAEASAPSHVSKRAANKAAAHTPTPSPTLPDPTRVTVPDGINAAAMVTAVAATPLATPSAAEVRPQALQGNPYLKDVALPSSDATTPLRTVELSPHVRIITDPRQAPSPESLTAFAKSMGLDEAAIQKLMGPTDTAQVQAMAATPGASDTANGLTVALNTPAAQLADKLAASSPTVTVTPLASQLPNAGLMAAAAANTAATAAATAAPILGAALQGLTPNDLASIQEIQITVLPPAVAPIVVASNTPSTASVLSLMGPGLSEPDISALAASFEQGAAGGDTAQQQASGGDTSGSAFGQALPRQVLPANTATAGTHATSDVHMSEVYDQLSDKMATEMAARMHKQLSDGEWKMKFGLRPANLGGVEIQLEMKDGKLHAMIQADNPLTRDLLQNSTQRLREALENFGIHTGQFSIGHDSRGAQQNPSGGSSKQPEVGENSISQVKNSSSTPNADAVSAKANASLLDLYA
ncbi:flagellar hook-length control protein FliK [Limnohabitans sp.]|uniref:flagellar hook-length control protein FliK n=1 Tax=Limnohabitans sp. TaxID=1907725 RepID=UPI0038B8F5FB